MSGTASTVQAMATMQATEPEAQALSQIHRYKLKPPFYNGDQSAFEEWKYRFTAYMGLMDQEYNHLLQQAEEATGEMHDVDLVSAATSREQGDKWIQLATDLKYLLINITTGAAATICRQF